LLADRPDALGIVESLTEKEEDKVQSVSLTLLPLPVTVVHGERGAAGGLSTRQAPLRHGDQPRAARYTDSMRIPTTLLSSAALRAVVEEFVTRDGTDHSSVEQRIEKVMRQLDASLIELHFDETTETCNILPVEGNPSESDEERTE
jgi:uncharacterized protein YheU (UPF0270 family)